MKQTERPYFHRIPRKLQYVFTATHMHELLRKCTIYNSNWQIYQLYMSSAVKIVLMLQQEHVNTLSRVLSWIQMNSSKQSDDSKQKLASQSATPAHFISVTRTEVFLVSLFSPLHQIHYFSSCLHSVRQIRACFDGQRGPVQDENTAPYSLLKFFNIIWQSGSAQTLLFSSTC